MLVLFSNDGIVFHRCVLSSEQICSIAPLCEIIIKKAAYVVWNKVYDLDNNHLYIVLETKESYNTRNG